MNQNAFDNALIRFTNPLFQIHQQYDTDASIATNPVNRYVFDLYLCNGTGRIKPHSRGHGAVVTGIINIKRYISPEDWISYPDKISLTYSVDGALISETKNKSSVPITADGWGLLIDRTFTNCTVDWINFAPVRPTVNYREDLRTCQYYYIGNETVYGNGLINTGTASQPGRFVVKLDKMRLSLSTATKGAIPSSGHAIFTSGGWNSQIRNLEYYRDVIAGEFYGYSNQTTGWLGIFQFKTPTIDANYYPAGV